mgnify:CR=1 FL=1
MIKTAKRKEETKETRENIELVFFTKKKKKKIQQKIIIPKVS